MAETRQTFLSPLPVTFGAPPSTVNRVSFGELALSALRQENTLFNLYDLAQKASDRLGTKPFRSDYDPFEGIDGTVFEEFPEALIYVDTPEEKAAAEQKILQELRDKQNIANAGGLGMLVSFIAAAADPLLMIPVGGTARALRAAHLVANGLRLSPTAVAPLRAGIATAQAGFVGEAAAQTVLFGAQETRPLGQSALNVAAATLLSGMLGTGIGILSAKARREAIAMIEQDLQGAIAGGATGREVVDGAPVITREEFLDPDATRLRLQSSYGVARINALTRFSPVLRAWIDSPSQVFKRSIMELGDQPFRVEGAENIGVSAESIALRYEADGITFHTERTLAYTRYRKRLADQRGIPSSIIKEGGQFRSVAIRARDRVVGREPGILSEPEFKEAVSFAAREGDVHPIPEVQEVAQYLRARILDPIAVRMTELGMLPEEILALGPVGSRTYLMRVYNKSKLVEIEPRFKERVLQPWLRSKITPEEIAAIEARGGSLEEEIKLAADDVFQSLIGFSQGRINYERVNLGTQRASPLKSRAIDIEDRVLSMWGVLDNDIDNIVESYLRTLGPDIGLRERFGSVDARRALQEHSEEYIRLRERAPDEKTRKALVRRQAEEAELFKSYIEVLRGTYKIPARTKTATAGRVLRTLNMTTQLGGVAISSMADVMMVPLVNGFARTFRFGLKPLIRELAHLRPPRLVPEAVRELNLGAAAAEMETGARWRSIADIGNELPRNKIETGAQGAGKLFMMGTGLPLWNTWWKRFAGTITQTRLLRNIESEGLGRLSRADLNEMEFLRLGSEMRGRIRDQITREGGMGRDGEVWFANTEAWDDLPAREAYRAALRLSTDTTIITPRLLDRPLLMNTEMGRTLFQYLSFGVTATNRLALISAQRISNGEKVLLLHMLWMMGMGMMVETSKHHLKPERLQKKRPLPDFDTTGGISRWLFLGADRSGIIGTYGDIIHKFSRVLGFDAVSNRYAARNTLGALLGPSFGTGQDIVQVAQGAIHGPTEGDFRTFRRLMPYSNYFYMRRLVENMEDGVIESLNLPKSRR